MSTFLPWPAERPPEAPLHPQPHPETRFDVPPSNCLLDLHGSLQDPELVLFMAGNQFRALPPLLDAFQHVHGPLRVFYATTPPGILIDAMASGQLASGNFVIELHRSLLWPDVFMAGPREYSRLAAAGWIEAEPLPYARNRGCALLVRRGNPLSVRSVADLARPDVRVAISSQEREPASFASYAATLKAQGGPALLAAVLAKPDTWQPQRVHHREIPQCLADGLADAAPLYLHLALYLSEQMPAWFETVELPEAGNHRDELAAAVLAEARHPEAAAAWCSFLCGPAGAAVLREHGFVPASEG
jgi:ABC-type molybdate transport system substrate-binding protein